METIKKNVKNLLTDREVLRDNDKLLVLQYWMNEIKNIHKSQIYDLSLFQFQEMMLTNKLTGWNSITRARRNLQEKNPNLRGKLWDKRHANQINVQRALGYNV